MSLLDDLKAAARVLDPQFQVSSNEVQSVVSSVVHYLEHGDSFLKAVEAGAEDVAHLLAPQPSPEASPEPGPGPAPAASSAADVAELERQVSDLEAQLAARQATANQTQVEHETGVGY